MKLPPRLWSSMDATRRAIILDEIDRWRAEGLLDEDEHLFLRARYDQGRDPRLDEPPTASAAYATHLVGGLLLGSAIIALVQFFVPLGVGQPLVAVGAATACALAAWLAELRRGPLVAEAGFAAALVAAASAPFYALTMPLLGLAAAGLAVAVTLLRRGRSPLALLAAGAFFVGAQGAARVDLTAVRAGAAEGAFLLALLAYGALLVAQREARWGAIALGAQGLGVTLALFPILDALGVVDPGIAALAVGICAAALFFAALQLGARPLAATSSATLTIAAVSFAFLALGPALAAMVLLLLGALLVWQAEALRGYFGARPAG